MSYTSSPLADRIRPKTLEEFIGQDKIIGENTLLRNAIQNDELFSMILWGPPGCGKTTLARIVAEETDSAFYQLSAVSSGKKDVREIIEKAKKIDIFQKKTILFLDEIHRFNKAQQDFLLPYVEDGTIILIGATTENPSFEVNSALLSRCRVFVLERHNIENIERLLRRAATNKKDGLGKYDIAFTKSGLVTLVEGSNGDVRNALNALENIVKYKQDKKRIIITAKDAEQALQRRNLQYDKNGEEHYNTISALHKSMRSSDANAAVYWVMRMLEAGEDPLYVARRMVRFASEDIGNADPHALPLAVAAFQACERIGMPECDVALVQLAAYLAKAPKSNASYKAVLSVREDVRRTLNEPVPFHLRNAETDLMKEIGYGKGYVYDHDLESKKSEQQCLPDNLKDKEYYIED